MNDCPVVRTNDITLVRRPRRIHSKPRVKAFSSLRRYRLSTGVRTRNEQLLYIYLCYLAAVRFAPVVH